MSVWIEDFIKLNKYSRSGMKLRARMKGILHYTANPGAGAKNHQRYFNNISGRYASAHIFVDKDEARLIVPLNEVAYQANDGTYRGVSELKPNANFLAIGVEMCLEKDSSFHPQTIARTENVFVELCKMFGWNPLKDIVRHYDVTHKNCPAPWVSNPKAFEAFKQRVNAKLNGQTVTQTAKPTASVTKPSTSSTYTGNSLVDYLKHAGQDSSFANRAKLAQQHGIKGYEGTAKQNTDLLNKLRGEPKPTQKPATSSYIGKRVESIHDGKLRFYNKPSWSEKDVVGHLTKGLGFPTIVDKVKVDNAYQYKVKNSKGADYYITAADRYVKLI